MCGDNYKMVRSAAYQSQKKLALELIELESSEVEERLQIVLNRSFEEFQKEEYPPIERKNLKGLNSYITGNHKKMNTNNETQTKEKERNKKLYEVEEEMAKELIWKIVYRIQKNSNDIKTPTNMTIERMRNFNDVLRVISKGIGVYE